MRAFLKSVFLASLAGFLLATVSARAEQIPIVHDNDFVGLLFKNSRWLTGSASPMMAARSAGAGDNEKRA
jgi:hypothetical protein